METEYQVETNTWAVKYSEEENRLLSEKIVTQWIQKISLMHFRLATTQSKPNQTEAALSEEVRVYEWHK